MNRNMRRLALLKPGEPCWHRGCLSHISHPCEVCGCIGGYPLEYKTIEILKEETYRSKSMVNMTDNMVCVTLTCSRNEWREIKRHLTNHSSGDVKKSYTICTDCTPHHYDNCETCFGYGISPIRGGNTLSVADWGACPECKSTPRGLPEQERRRSDS